MRTRSAFGDGEPSGRPHREVILRNPAGAARVEVDMPPRVAAVITRALGNNAKCPWGIGAHYAPIESRPVEYRGADGGVYADSNLESNV